MLHTFLIHGVNVGSLIVLIICQYKHYCDLKWINSQHSKYNIYILNYWSVYIIDISILQPQNNLRILSILCNKWCFFTECFVCISDYNDNSCVYIHDQALMKTACPGGVITLLYLKHPIFLTFYRQQVPLPRTTGLSVGLQFTCTNTLYILPYPPVSANLQKNLCN